MARLMCVSTHHKCGTVWMRRVFTIIGRRLDIPWVGLWGPQHLRKLPETGRAFVFNWHGWFPDELRERDDVAFFHMIRDPRDVLISGMHYHLNAGVEGEKWLHEPRQSFNGRSYQEALRALPSYEDKLKFEMFGKHLETLQEMREWPWQDPRNYELSYETLINPAKVARFRHVLAHLGLSPEEIEIGQKVLWTHSLFGQLKETPMTSEHQLTHIKSAKTKRYTSEMPRAIGAHYASHFSQDLINLGYARGNAWVKMLPTHVDPNSRTSNEH